MIPGQIALTWIPRGDSSELSDSREAHHRVLRGRVGRHLGDRHEPRHRGGVHDVAGSALGEHPRHEEVHAVHHAHQVHAEHALPLLEARLVHRPGVAHAGVVVEHVHGAVLGEHALGQRLDRGRVAHVGGVHRRLAARGLDLAGHPRGARLVHVHHVHLGAEAGEQQRGGAPDARAGAGDHGHLAREVALVARHGGTVPARGLPLPGGDSCAQFTCHRLAGDREAQKGAATRAQDAA